MKTITIKLTGPLQSFGNEATFNQRTTSLHPSKSAVIGMIAAALGFQRDDEKITDLNGLDFAVRIDQPGRVFTEFQTVEWKKDTRKLTYRGHIQDAVFAVAIGSDNDSLIDEIQFALRHPGYQLFLGRRANVPAGVLQIEEFSGLNPVQVLKDFPWQASRWYQKSKSNKQTVKVELLADSKLLSGDKYFMVKDSVGSFSQKNRFFNYRPVERDMIELTNPSYQEKDQSTDHDPFSAL
ncbi:type I-E CRISPR-associated protein Cas5/CasD [Xylocopilactobacillus apicola]|uniref:Type I-E CRISPR-associated protein Cas5/CasD n=1 Tax=Xylocopilactobacillus apicola TaxID=2932184 RepID=A0AAU9DXV8_9LACO|nr:type I-E CRISPR-associated protein Cas5/CasD [Xylocopilactobacillus apicola]BDR58968.1 type I-E CRISPR-associated protein Cas5/CasD [Xylocopilactobacillus apicola]